MTRNARGIRPPDLPLDASDVDVWIVPLDRPARPLADLEAILSPDERDRARRFAFEHLRARYLAARGLLRILLGGYTGVAPDQVALVYGAHGKPALASPGGLRFNLSHSGTTALYAVTRGREIGVDVEEIRHDFATLEIAERFFAPGEVQALRAIPPANRARAFFACWTRKEAYIKARGEGLSFPLHRFRVSLTPEAAALVEVADDPDEAARWRLHALDVGEGLAAALAVEGYDWRVRLRAWSDS